MQLPAFLMHRWQIAHEFDPIAPIRCNLSGSTGPSWDLGALMALCGDALQDDLKALRLSYAPPEGSRLLREKIAELYGIDPDWVVVTTGAAEGMSAVFCLAAASNASVVLPAPAFPSMAAFAQAWGLKVCTYTLDRAAGFAQTAASVLAAVDETMRLAVVNSPHSPTGAVMAASQIAQLATALGERGIPLLVNEVYHPLYFGAPNPSAVSIPNTIVVSDLSKAFSLSGLRVGWIIDPDPQRRVQLIDLRSYFTVSSSPLSERLAAHALGHREVLHSRLNDTTRANLAALEAFMARHRDILGWVSPAGGTVAFPWFVDGRDSRPVCQELVRAGVLLVPGDCFAVADHFRVGLGADTSEFQEALDIISRVLLES